MCQERNSTPVWVKIQADLSHKGEEYWKHAKVDACIAPIVDALQKGGIDMRGSCCGHDEAIGEIHLQDGRALLILGPEASRRWIAADVEGRKAVIDALMEMH